MRNRRGTALVAALLSSALVLSGCARDTGSAPAADGGGDGETCARNAAPAAAGGAAPSAAAVAPNADASALRVGLAYDIGGRGDQSFNDAVFAGLERAIGELGLDAENTRDVAAGQNESEDANTARLRQLATEGFNPVIAVGFAYAAAVETVATEFPDVQFGIVDDNTVELPNVTGLVFAEEQGSFLVGAAAALRSEHACAILGHANAEGHYGFDKDPQEATRWYREMQECDSRDSLDENREQAAAWLREHP